MTARRFTPGAPLASIGAGFLNDLAALVDSGKTGKPGANVATAGDGAWNSSVVIKVKNTTSAAVPLGGVLALTVPVITPAQNRPEWNSQIVMLGTAPGNGATKICVTLEPLAAGAIGRAVIVGAVHTRIDSSDFESVTQFAAPLPSRTDAFRFADSGTPILWHSAPDEDGIRDATILLDQGRLIERRDATGTTVNGCNVDHCVPEGSYVVSDIACGGCAQTPNSYTLETPVVNQLSRFATHPCCEENLYTPPQTALELNPITGETVYARTRHRLERIGSTCVYASDWFQCPEMLSARVCGSALWEWATGFREVDCSVTWTAVETTCTGCFHTWFWDDSGGAGVWNYGSQTGDCPSGVSSPSAPPPRGPGDPTVVNTPCTPVSPVYDWVCSDDFRQPECAECGAQGGCHEEGFVSGPPTTPPASLSDTVTRTCTIMVEDPEASQWVQITSCRCGTTSPPSTPGTSEGERRMTPCLINGASDGYPVDFRWRLTIGVGDATKLELVDSNGEVYLTYQTHAGRPWCCLCTNPMQLATCGPFWTGCNPLGSVCLIPDEASCGSGSRCFGNKASVTLSGLPDVYAFSFDGDVGPQLDDINATYILEPLGGATPVAGCLLGANILIGRVLWKRNTGTADTVVETVEEADYAMCYYITVDFWPQLGVLLWRYSFDHYGADAPGNPVATYKGHPCSLRYDGNMELSNVIRISIDLTGDAGNVYSPTNHPLFVGAFYRVDSQEQADDLPCNEYVLPLVYKSTANPDIYEPWRDLPNDHTITIEVVE